MVYYSRLPYASIGPLHFGAQQAENVGLCDAPGMTLTDDGHCVIEAGTLHATRAAACALMGASLHSDGERCALTREQFCATVPGTTFAADGTCDHNSVMMCSMIMAVNDDPRKSVTLHSDGRCTITNAAQEDCPTPLVNGTCIVEPIRSDAREMCTSNDGTTTWESGVCLGKIPEICPPMTIADPQTGICRADFQAMIEGFKTIDDEMKVAHGNTHA